MKYILAILFLIFFIPIKTFAQECSVDGYSVVTINGVFTKESDAIENKDKLKKLFPSYYNNEKLKFDYLLNPSHIAGIGDIAKSVYQGIFDEETVTDYDLTEMIRDASKKVTTQKMLIVAHSQGNFYANSFYDVVTNDGVNPDSIGVYAVATPSSRVAGGGKWLTSDTDKVISTLIGRVLKRKIMEPNTHIEIKDGDDNLGHSFSDIYLKYKGDKIISDINSSLNSLKSNPDKDGACIKEPDLTLVHRITGALFSIVDPLANLAKEIITTTISTLKDLVTKQEASVIGAFPPEPIVEKKVTTTQTKPIEIQKKVEVVENKLEEKVFIPEQIITTPTTVPPAIFPVSGGRVAESNPVVTNPPQEENIPIEEEDTPTEDPVEEAPTEETEPIEEEPEDTTQTYTYTYIANNTFGTENGDGNDWQVWGFVGSYVYDWQDFYSEGYLVQVFKVKSYAGDAICLEGCIEYGVFDHDPRNGFEIENLYARQLEVPIQNSSDGKIYDVEVRWSSTGYSYNISTEGITSFEGDVVIPNISTSSWIGWNTGSNNFKTFPSGHWVGEDVLYDGFSGGVDMVTIPKKIYIPQLI